MDFKEMIPSRYRVTYDKQTGAFWILDCWHDTIRNIPDIENAVVDQNSPALTILSTEQTNALIGELIRLGWLDKLKSTEETSQQKVSIPEKVKTVEEIAIVKIVEVVKTENLKDDIAKEAIMAIRNLGMRQ